MSALVAPKTIAIVLFDGFEELDAVGPYEVLAYWTGEFADDGWRVVTVSRDGSPATGAKGLTVAAHTSYADVGPIDLLVYPGGQGTRRQLKDPAELDWLRQRRDEASLLASVCTGALVYAAAGFLGGRPATTYWSAFDELTALEPSVIPQPGRRFVDDGDIVTSAGVSAGIDMALHLVRRLAGEERARAVRRGIEYDPEPPV